MIVVTDGLSLLRPNISDEYEIRVAAYYGLVCNMPFKIGSCSIEPGYDCETDCELREWDERANEDRSWVDWWEADWIEPEDYDYD